MFYHFGSNCCLLVYPSLVYFYVYMKKWERYLPERIQNTAHLQNYCNNWKISLRHTTKIYSNFIINILDLNTSWEIFAGFLLSLQLKCYYKKRQKCERRGKKRRKGMIINLVLDSFILCFVCPWTADPLSDEPVPEQMVYLCSSIEVRGTTQIHTSWGFSVKL